MAMQPVLKKQTILWLEPWLVCATISSPILLKEKEKIRCYIKIESKPNKFRKSIPEQQKKSHYENHKGHFDQRFLEKNHSKNYFCSPNQKKINPILFFSPLRSQNHMKKAQRHHDYLSSEWKKKSKYLNQRKKSPQVPKTISKFLTVRSCDKKVRKKLGQQKWKLKKKTRETKVWLQKKKKEEKLKTWASSKLKIKKNKKPLFFPIIKKS